MAEARSAHSRAEGEWQRALELERRLKATYRKRSFYDQEARTLRGQLRAAYESLLFLDAAFAAANDVELLLWKSVFYRPIEEFRARMKQTEQANDAATLRKVAAAFVRFLEDSSLFYRRLVMQLQAAYGDVGVKLPVEASPAAGGGGGGTAAAANGAAAMLCSSGSSAPRDVRPSIHRCLIYLGDLARYTAQAAPKAAPPAAAPAAGPGQHPAAKQEWQRAAQYYRLAARVLPRSGNPHNQLAVMAVMTGDELRAVYHYARSLCVGIPFWTARENLLLLFEQNRARYGEYAAQRRQRQQQQQQQQLSLGQLLSNVSMCYVRLSGLLFDKINQQEYQPVSDNAAAALSAFLSHPSVLDGLQRQTKADSTPLHLVVLSIFAVQNACSSGSDRRASGSEAGVGAGSGGLAAAAAAQQGGVGSYGDAAQRSLQRSRALATAFRTGRLLLQAAAAAVPTAAANAANGAGAAGNGGAAAGVLGQRTGVSRLLVAANVLLQWLAAQPAFAVLHPTHASEEEGRARAAFWAAAAQLIAALSAAFPAQASQGACGKPIREAGGNATVIAAQAGAAAAAARGGSGSAGGDASCDGGALPEELELLGFEPLRSKHHWHVTDVGKFAVDEPATRACRMLAAARVVSASLTAEQQLGRHSAAAAAAAGGGVQAQTLRQLAAALQQFVESVAAAAAGGGGRVTAAGSAAEQGAQSTAAAAAAGAAGRHSPGAAAAAAVAGNSAGEGAADDAVAMDTDLLSPRRQQQQLQQQQEDEEDAEEVIVFKPRTARPSAASSDDGAAAAPAAAAAGGPPATLQPLRPPPSAAAAAAAAEPPPLPQQLLASRQQGRLSASSSQCPSGVSSPAAAASSPVRQQRQQQQVDPMVVSPQAGNAKQQRPAAAAAETAEAAKPGIAGGSRSSTPRSGSSTPAVPAAAGNIGSSGAAGMLLHGHAATALDLQQAQAASDMLLARLNAKTPPQPPLGSGLGVGAGSSGLGPSGLGGGLPPAPGFSSFGGGQQGPAPGFNRSSSGITGSSLRSQPPSPAVFGGAAAAGVALGLGALAGGLQVPAVLQQQQQQQQQPQLSGLGAATAAAGGGSLWGADATLAGLGLQLSSLVPGQQQQQQLGGGDTLSVNLGFGLGLSQQGLAGNFEGFDPLGFGLSSALSPGGTGAGFDDPLLGLLGGAGAAAAAAAAGGLGYPSAPIQIAQQQQQLLERQQQMGSSAAAAYELEQTAKAAADRILSPEHDSTGLRLLQQQQQAQQQQQHSGLAGLAPGFGGSLAPATGLAGSSDLAAAAAAAGIVPGGLASALQTQQHVLSRRLSGADGPASSPSAFAASFGRGAFDAQQQQQQQLPPLGRISAPSLLGRPSDDGSLYSPAAAGAAAAAHNGGLQDSYAMFSGPSMFGGAAAAADAGLQQRRISSSSMTGSHSSQQGIPPTAAAGAAAGFVSGVPGLQLGGLAGRDQGSGFGLGQGEGLVPDSPTSPENDGLTLLEYLAKQQQQQQQLAGALSSVTPAVAAGGTGGALAGGLNVPPGYSGVGFGVTGGLGLGAQQGLGLGLSSGAFGGAGVRGGAASAAGLFPGSGPAVLLPPLDVVQSQNPFAS